MFRRSKTPTEPTTTAADAADRPQSKGRPTPTRREAEAASRARARAAIEQSGDRKARRQQRAHDTARAREGMRTGDERYLPARDQGPVRRYVRDFVDGRLCVGEFILPLLVIILLLQMAGRGSSAMLSLSNALWTATILLTLVDTAWMLIRLRRGLAARFPGESLRGTTFYAVMRMMQVRFMRVPKRKVRLGQKPR